MLSVLLLLACTDSADDTGTVITDTDTGPDPCTSWAAPAMQIGKGVGGAFVAYEENAEVGLTVAPQGGFGVVVLASTQGLVAGDGKLVDVLLETLIDDVVSGTFVLEQAPFYCNSNGTGGFLSGVVVGFNSTTYSSNDSLLSLNGQIVTLHVGVTDEIGGYAEVFLPVTIVVGNE